MGPLALVTLQTPTHPCSSQFTSAAHWQPQDQSNAAMWRRCCSGHMDIGPCPAAPIQHTASTATHHSHQRRPLTCNAGLTLLHCLVHARHSARFVPTLLPDLCFHGKRCAVHDGQQCCKAIWALGLHIANVSVEVCDTCTRWRGLGPPCCLCHALPQCTGFLRCRVSKTLPSASLTASNVRLVPDACTRS
jgi:hypothetical protein